jgi:hypothetical protein
MDLTREAHMTPDELINKCACCFQVFKKQQKIVNLNLDLEMIFSDVVQTEVSAK